MDKRQSYSIKEAASLPEPRKLRSRKSVQVEPECSYMFGGLGDLRRQPYIIRSPLRERDAITNTESHEPTPKRAAPAKTDAANAKYCDAATVAEKFRAAPSVADGAVKVNPLLLSTSGEGGKGPLLCGQTEKIRRTKEREMLSAIMEVANHGKFRSLTQKKCFPFLPAKRETAKRWLLGGKKKRKRSGPFILRPRPTIAY